VTSAPATTTPSEGSADPTPTSTTGPPPTTDEELPEVTSTIAGSAVAGNSGQASPSLEDNRTDRLSEVVRLENGHCIGWDGPQTGRWTQGLADGAELTVLHASTGAVIGSGVFEDSSWADPDPGDNDQWTCTFPFTATIEGAVPKTFKIKVGDLEPWTVRADPTRPKRFVTSVSTVASASLVPDCSGGIPDVVTLWSPVVGQYWSNALAQLCSSGITIAKVERTCRARTVGSDHAVAVLSATDGSVLEDAAGQRVEEGDLANLPQPPAVIVRVANGQPCG
jgi:hypothetical protein